MTRLHCKDMHMGMEGKSPTFTIEIFGMSPKTLKSLLIWNPLTPPPPTQNPPYLTTLPIVAQSIPETIRGLCKLNTLYKRQYTHIHERRVYSNCISLQWKGKQPHIML